MDPETEFPQELLRIQADLEYDIPQLHGRFQVTEDGDEVYLMPDACFAAAPVPQNKDVRVSVDLCDDDGNWEKVWNKIQWSRLPQHHMQSRALAVTYDYYMMYYHNAEHEYRLEMMANGRLENIPKERRGALLGEVFTDTEPIAWAACWKGHAVMPSISLKMGFDLYPEDPILKKINLRIGFEEGPIPIEYWSSMSPLCPKKDQYRYWSRLVQIGQAILVQIGHVDDHSSFVVLLIIYISYVQTSGSCQALLFHLTTVGEGLRSCTMQ